MLQFIREKASGTLFKLLFGMLIVSFAAWGIGDYAFLRSGSDTAIEVGSRKIPLQQVDAEYRQARERLRRAFGVEIDEAMLRQFGLLDQTVDRLAAEAALDAEAARLGLVASDAIVRQRIANDPNFRGAGGQFDRFLFQRLLFDNGFTEQRYIELVRADIVRSQLREAVEAGVQAPLALAETLYRHRNEKRGGSRVFVANAAFDDIGTPSDADLAQTYQANGARFTAPEYRALSVVRLTAEDVATQVTVDDKALADEFEQRRREFEQPEQRELKQMLFDSQEAAQAAATAIAGGKSFDAVAAETPGQSPERTGLGLVARDETLPAIGAAVFEAAAGAIVGPVRTPFGWHVLQVVRIEPGTEATLESVRARIEPALRQRLAAEKAFDIANRLEDQVTRGRALDEAAANAGATVVKVAAIDARGLDDTGAPVALFAGAPEALRAAFDTLVGRESQLIETRSGGFFLLHVDGSTPAQRRAFDSVKEDVAALWKAERQAERALARAREIVAATAAGETLEAAALRFNLRVEAVPAVLRTGENASVPSAVAARLFALKPGQTGLAAGIDGQFVVRTGDIVAADPAADPAALAALRAQLAREMAGDLSTEYNQALRQKFGVTINRSVVERLN